MTARRAARNPEHRGHRGPPVRRRAERRRGRGRQGLRDQRGKRNHQRLRCRLADAAPPADRSRAHAAPRNGQPERATCCLRRIRDPGSRAHRHPFGHDHAPDRVGQARARSTPTPRSFRVTGARSMSPTSSGPGAPAGRHRVSGEPADRCHRVRAGRGCAASEVVVTRDGKTGYVSVRNELVIKEIDLPGAPCWSLGHHRRTGRHPRSPARPEEPVGRVARTRAPA